MGCSDDSGQFQPEWPAIAKIGRVPASVSAAVQVHDERPYSYTMIRWWKVDNEVLSQSAGFDLVQANLVRTRQLPPADCTWPSELANEKHNGHEKQEFQHSVMNEDGDPSEKIHFRDVAPAIEFVCWVVVALAPLLRWVNGPAVTDDQFVVQMTLFGIALLGGLSLRLYQFLGR